MPTRLPDDVKLDSTSVGTDTPPKSNGGPTRLSGDIKLDANPSSSSSNGNTTTLGGMATSAARGLGPTAIGAAAGGAIGGPAGALVGGGAMGLADLALNTYNIVADANGWPRAKTGQDAADRLVDLLGGKPKEQQSGLERITESTIGGAAGAQGQIGAAAQVAERAVNPLLRGVAEKAAERPLAQTVGGALGGAGAQTTAEMGFTDPVSQTLGGLAAGSLGGAAVEGMSRPIGNVSGRMGLEPPQVVEDRHLRAANRTENEARETVSDRFARGVRGGAPNAVDIIEKLDAAKREGQPYRLIDTENHPLRGLAGRVYREGGEAQQEVRGFLAERSKGARDRMKGLLGKYLSNESMMETAEELETLRSQTGKALWAQAFDGGSVAPLEQQYQSAWVKAGQDEHAAMQQLQQAQQKMTLAAAKKATAGNVYSTSGANVDVRNAIKELREAQDALATAQTDKQATLDKLQTAQIDRQTNAPGGIWSPYLDRISQQPEIRRGIRTGIGIERRDAVGENRPFNVTEYALNDKGDVISVPNMRTWSVAKKGLDAILRSPNMRDPLTGRLNEVGVSYAKLRDGLVKELDELNPYYKEARQHWGGFTASRQALQDGKDALKESKFSPEELKAHFKELADGDKQFFFVGLADELRTRLRRVGETGDKARIISEDVRERLEGIFSNEEEASRFMNAVEREAGMKQAENDIVKRSATAERLAEDNSTNTASKLRAASDWLRSGFHFSHGSWPLAAGMALRGVGHVLRDRPNMARNEAVTRLLLGDDVASLIARGQAANGQGTQLFPLLDRPQGLSSRMLPGAALGAGLTTPNQTPQE